MVLVICIEVVNVFVVSLRYIMEMKPKIFKSRFQKLIIYEIFIMILILQFILSEENFNWKYCLDRSNTKLNFVIDVSHFY